MIAAFCVILASPVLSQSLYCERISGLTDAWMPPQIRLELDQQRMRATVVHAWSDGSRSHQRPIEGTPGSLRIAFDVQGSSRSNQYVTMRYQLVVDRAAGRMRVTGTPLGYSGRYVGQYICS